jgi:cold shock CspA family protein
MQATVSAFDDATRSGFVLLDDGRQLSFSGEALQGTGLRFLRPGQRVTLEVVDGTRVQRVQILTLR